VRWCGLLVQTVSLELMADYSRYSGQHIASSLTLNRWGCDRQLVLLWQHSALLLSTLCCSSPRARRHSVILVKMQFCSRVMPHTEQVQRAAHCDKPHTQQVGLW
jgi:hypothetical protein